MSLGWLDDERFAVSSMDPRIYVFKMGEDGPVCRFSHGADVNKVSWNSSNNILMTCSDDSTLKFWQIGEKLCVWNAMGHSGKVNSCQWCPARTPNVVARFVMALLHVSFGRSNKLLHLCEFTTAPLLTAQLEYGTSQRISAYSF